MSVDVVFQDTAIALKTLWEAVLLDENGDQLNWTTPLITSINTPRMKLQTAPVDGGSMKAYIAYELPDNITLTMFETVTSTMCHLNVI